MTNSDQLLTRKQLDEWETQIGNLIDDHNIKPDYKNYVSATFSYLLSALEKIESAEDKDKATNEVSEDAVNKLVSWAQPLLDDWAYKQEQKEGSEENGGNEENHEKTEKTET